MAATTSAAQTDSSIAAVGGQIRALRNERQLTLAELSDATGISISTLSRLESGQRRPQLELLLPVARALDVTIDDLLTVPTSSTPDPRVHGKAFRSHGMTMVPLTRRSGGIQAYKIVIPASRRRSQKPDPRTHYGYEWLYVVSGRLRLVLADHDIVLEAGEAAEFDTRLPHWFTAADGHAAELLILFGPQGEKVHVRARPADPAHSPRGASVIPPG